MAKRRSAFPDFTLNRNTAHGIVTVAIFAVAVLLLLSIFELAGRLGVAVDKAAANALGWQRLALPMFLLAIGIHEVSPKRLPLKATQYVGFVLFFLSLNPLVHTTAVVENTAAVSIDKLGGKLGSLLSEPIVNLMGRPGAITLFAAFFAISLLLIFNTSVRSVAAKLSWILGLLLKILRVLALPFGWAWLKFTERKDEQIRATVAPPVPEEIATKHGNIADDLDAALSGSEEDGMEEGAPRVHVVPPRPRKRYPKVEIPIELLTKRDQKPNSGDIASHQNVIRRTLETFGIAVEMGDVAVGPTVTQFTLKPAEGVKLSKITALHNDLALALAAHPIRIEAPIPGKPLVGIEVPNQSVATVGFREMVESREWRDRRGALPFVIGRDVTGKPWIGDLGRMPHLLVAGATGSGKSVCLNILLMSLLYSYGPDDLKIILVDPKRVELQVYNGIPHLVTPVISDVEKTVNALKWALREMDRRFDVLSKFGARDLATYNTRSDEKIPNLVIVIDELADLMVTAMQEVEGPIVRLAQMARAVGIHLVLATQRPSVDVITGLIKANIPARIAFAVASSTDSRTIVDTVGAEKLLGRGDMLFQTSDMPSMKRLQGAFVSDEEISRVVEFLKSKYEPADYDPSVVEKPSRGGTSFSSGDTDDSDELLPAAKEEILRAGKASASLLQRRLKVGYARAARILDLLEAEGFIGPSDGAKPRDILKAEFTNQMEPLPPTHAALEQVDREIPDIEDEESAG